MRLSGIYDSRSKHASGNGEILNNRHRRASLATAASRSVGITYVPADCGSLIAGKSKVPEAFRDVGISGKLENAGIPHVSECYALELPATYTISELALGRIRNEGFNVLVCQEVYQAVTKSLETSSQPPFQLIIGGECCMSPGVLSAFWHHVGKPLPKSRVGLVYIDADTDLVSPTDPTSTGMFACMSMTHLVRNPGALESMAWFCRPSGEPLCDASNTVLFGTKMSAAGNKNEHFAYLFNNSYKVITSDSVAGDPEARAREALKFLEERVDVIMVHLDVDAIDPRMFPLANIPNSTGFSFDSMMSALRVFLSSKIGGLTIAEVNPDHDPGLQMTGQLTDQIVTMLAARK
ncbi:Arginase/deacetylase [Paramyrothecium foliicola]|nr:Arginase/deacetylase [Paramyrothecium foliicola]